MKKLLCLPSLALLLGGLLMAGCDESAPTESKIEIPNITTVDLQGEPFLLSETQGKVVLLSFFQPSCAGCQAEAPVLRALHEQFADDGLVIVGIDAGISTEEELQEFKEEFDLPFRILYDDAGLITRGYGVRRTPTTYVITRDADLYGPYVGAHPEEEWIGLLQPLLEAGEG